MELAFLRSIKLCAVATLLCALSAYGAQQSKDILMEMTTHDDRCFTFTLEDFMAQANRVYDKKIKIIIRNDVSLAQNDQKLEEEKKLQALFDAYSEQQHRYTPMLVINNTTQKNLNKVRLLAHNFSVQDEPALQADFQTEKGAEKVSLRRSKRLAKKPYEIHG